LADRIFRLDIIYDAETVGWSFSRRHGSALSQVFLQRWVTGEVLRMKKGATAIITPTAAPGYDI
jgi:hypothetical protein